MKTLYRSFAGGVITPEMAGRVDLVKFQTGLAEALNTVILPHGPAARRAGTRYVMHTRYGVGMGTRLIPFQYSATQACVIEFGERFVRFHGPEGTQLESAHPITSAALLAGKVQLHVPSHGFSAGDTVYVSNAPSMPYTDGRFVTVVDVQTANTFTIDGLDGGLSPAAVAFTDTGATAARVYTLAAPYFNEGLASLRYAQSADVLTLTSGGGDLTYELRRLSATSWEFARVDFAVTLPAPGSVAAAATMPTATNPIVQHYKVCSVGPDLITQSAASADATCTNNLSIFGNFNTVTWAAAPGAARYYVYKLRGGVYGYIGQTATTSIVDDNITPDVLTTPPEPFITLCADAFYRGDQPSTTVYHQQRRWFAGTHDKPQSVFATRNGTENNLTSSIPQQIGRAHV